MDLGDTKRMGGHFKGRGQPPRNEDSDHLTHLWAAVNKYVTSRILRRKILSQKAYDPLVRTGGVEKLQKVTTGSTTAELGGNQWPVGENYLRARGEEVTSDC